MQLGQRLSRNLHSLERRRDRSRLGSLPQIWRSFGISAIATVLHSNFKGNLSLPKTLWNHRSMHTVEKRSWLGIIGAPNLEITLYFSTWTEASDFKFGMRLGCVTSQGKIVFKSSCLFFSSNFLHFWMAISNQIQTASVKTKFNLYTSVTD